jgi:DNA polymerase-1
LRNYISEQIDFARENGYVQTVLGRRRYLKDINGSNAVVRGAAERNAVNAPIQGSAADIIKIAMINIHKKLEAGNYKSKMLLQVHDELVFDIFKPELEELKTMIKSEMENAYKLSVPLDVELGVGNNWLEAH